MSAKTKCLGKVLGESWGANVEMWRGAFSNDFLEVWKIYIIEIMQWKAYDCVGIDYIMYQKLNEALENAGSVFFQELSASAILVVLL